MNPDKARRWLQVASVLALFALGLMVWSFLDPQPLAMVFFMTVGQGLGTASLGIYVVVVGIELLRGRREGDAPEKEG